MRALVTGAAGFIGSHLAQALARDGHEVIGLDCFEPYYAERWKRANARVVAETGVRFVPVDLACDDLSVIPRDIQIVYHLAAQPGLKDMSTFDLYVRNNVTATHRLIEGLRDYPELLCFVYGSTSSVYGSVVRGCEETAPRPTSPYGVTKLAAEQLALAHYRERGFPACSVRMFSVYGPRERPDKLFPRLLASMFTGEEFPFYEGSDRHSRAFTYVGDAVAGLLKILDQVDRCVGEIINLGSTTEIATGDAVSLAQDILGRPARTRTIGRRAGDQLHTRAIVTKAREFLGFEAKTAFAEGLKAEVEWFRSEILDRGLWPPH